MNNEENHLLPKEAERSHINCCSAIPGSIPAMAPLNVIIIGAGIAGPAAAIGLSRNGHIVTIYERSTDVPCMGDYYSDGVGLSGL